MTLDRKTLPEHHLKYEIDMFYFTSNFLSYSVYLPEKYSPYNNAILESYLNHLRNIIDFLWVDDKNNSDITANSFKSKLSDGPNSISRNSSINIDKIGGLNIQEVKKRINKENSHLTIEREYYDIEKKWCIREISCCISDYMAKYMAQCCMDPEYSIAIKKEIDDYKEKNCVNDSNPTKRGLGPTFSTTASVTTTSVIPLIPHSMD